AESLAEMWGLRPDGSARARPSGSLRRPNASAPELGRRRSADEMDAERIESLLRNHCGGARLPRPSSAKLHNSSLASKMYNALLRTKPSFLIFTWIASKKTSG